MVKNWVLQYSNMKNKFTSSLNDFLTAVMYADDRSAVYFPPTFIGGAEKRI